MASPFPFTSGQVLTAAQLNSIGETTAFTPSWTNFTPGNAVEDWYYTQVNDLVIVTGATTLGSTSSVTGLITMNEPVGTMAVTSSVVYGNALLRDDAPGSNFAGVWQASGGNFILLALNAAGTYAAFVGATATVPHTWATSDVIAGTIAYQLS